MAAQAFGLDEEIVYDALVIAPSFSLVVSDNSASGAALVGRTPEQQQQYDFGKNVVLPDMILTLAAE